MKKANLFKRASITAVVFVILVSLILALSPYILSLSPAKKFVEGELSKRTNALITIKRIRFSYFPSPNFLISDLLLKKGGLSIRAEKLMIYPEASWLLNPRKMPAIDYELKKGEIYIGKGTISFLSLRGRLSENLDCEARIRLGREKLRDISSLFMKENPIEGEMQSLTVRIKTNLKRRDSIKVSGLKLSLSRPLLMAEGGLSVYKHEDGTRIDADIRFKGVDLKDLRGLLLHSFSKNKVVRDVTNIVRGGIASSGQVVFSGRPEALKHIENFYIQATGKGVPLYIPKVNLFIDQASGPIEIVKGRLLGKGLSGKLKGTICKDARIRLDLTGKRKRIYFSTGIDANADDILWALKKFVKDKGFQERLTWIKKVSGRAHGTLIIDGPLKNPGIQVIAEPEAFSIGMQYAPWPILLQAGRIDVTTEGKTVVAKDVRISLRDSLLSELSGSFSWKPLPLFQVNTLKARMDCGEFQGFISRFPRIEKGLKEVLTSCSGHIEIRNAKVSGSLSQLKKTAFNITIEGGDTWFKSPKLPGRFKVKDIKGTISNGHIILRDVSILHEGRFPLQISLDLRHNLFHDWSGWMRFSGTFDAGFSDWLTKKDWIPRPYFPNFPLILRNFTVYFGRDDKVEVRGGFEKCQGNEACVQGKIDLLKQTGLIAIKDLSITSPLSSASLTLKAEEKKEGKNGAFSFSYHGVLDGKDLDALIQENQLLRGTLRGDLSFCVGACTKDYIQARIKGKGLLWSWGLKRPILLDHFSVGQDNTRAVIKELSIQDRATTAMATGYISAGIDGFSVSLNMKAPNMDVESAIDLVSKPKEQPEEGFSWPDMLSDLLLKISISKVTYTDLVFRDLTGELFSRPRGRTSLYVEKATWCGLNVASTMTLEGKGSNNLARIRIWSGDTSTASFENVLSCLGIPQDPLTGRLKADILLEGLPGAWKRGKVRITGKAGRIRHATLLPKIFSILNVLDLFSKKSLNDLFSSTLPYSRLELSGTIRNNKLELKRIVLRAEGLNFFGKGTVGLEDWNVDLYVLVSPFKTLDLLLSKLPIIGYVIGGKNRTLVTVPMKVYGNIRNPDVVPLHPEALGKGFLDLFKDIINIPVRIVVPERAD